MFTSTALELYCHIYYPGVKLHLLQLQPHNCSIPRQETVSILLKMPPPKPAKGEYIETVSNSPNLTLSIHTKSPNPPQTKEPQPNDQKKKTGHRKQNLPPIPNPRNTTHHPGRQNCNPSRSRNPRRPIPHRNTPAFQRPQQPSCTSSRKPQHAQRGNNSRTI